MTSNMRDISSALKCYHIDPRAVFSDTESENVGVIAGNPYHEQTALVIDRFTQAWEAMTEQTLQVWLYAQFPSIIHTFSLFRNWLSLFYDVTHIPNHLLSW